MHTSTTTLNQNNNQNQSKNQNQNQRNNNKNNTKHQHPNIKPRQLPKIQPPMQLCEGNEQTRTNLEIDYVIEQHLKYDTIHILLQLFIDNLRFYG